MDRQLQSPAHPFVGRDADLSALGQWLDPIEVTASRVVLLRGDSGTGKTTLALHALAELARGMPRQSLLYLDLQEDEFTTANFFEALVCLSWNANPGGLPPEPRVPEKTSFREFSRQRRFRHAAWEGLYEGVRRVSSAIPGVGRLASALPDAKVFAATSAVGSQVASVFTEYLKWAAKRVPVLICIDNYQFLGRDARLLFESRLAALRTRVRILIIDRTIDGQSALGSVLCFPGDQWERAIAPFDPPQTRALVGATLPRMPRNAADALARDCQLKTGGNLKLIDLYLRSVLSRVGEESSDIQSPVELLARLPKLARSIVLLTSIFTAGLRQKYVESILRTMVGSDPESIERAIREMTAMGYVVINGGTGDTLRAHERVVAAMKEAVDESEFLELRDVAVRTFDSVLAGHRWSGEEYYYLIHCLIGILHLREVVARIDWVVELLHHEYQMSHYGYLAHIYRSFPEVVRYLPMVSVREVLDSLQRTCEIALGMTAVQSLRTGGVPDGGLLDLYEAKYLIQQYRYREALTRLATMPESEDAFLQKLLALESLCRDEEALRLLEASLDSCPSVEVKHIILRNAAHLYTFESAEQHLKAAVLHFETIRDGFAAGTTLNNLGVVYLWAGRWEAAEASLNRAHETLMRVGSHEHLQPTVNLGVLEAARGDLARAELRLREARPFVPPQMLWDMTLIDTNATVIALMRGSLDPAAALSELRVRYGDGLRIGDPRLYNLIAWNIEALEIVGGLPTTVEPEAWFRTTVRSRVRTGYEVELPWSNGRETTLLLGLSPQWRH